MNDETVVGAQMVAVKAAKGMTKKKNEWLFVNPYLVVGVVGASLAFAWFYSVLLAPEFVFSYASGTLLQLCHMVFAASLVVAYVVIWLLSNVLQKHRGVLVWLALACGAAGLISGGGGVCAVFLLVKAACAGIGASSLLALWGEFLCVHLKGQVRAAVAALFVLVFVWCLGVLLVDARFAPFAVCAYAVVSGCVYLFLRLRFSLMDSMPLVDSRESDERLQITWKPSLLTVMGSLAQGFSLYGLLEASDYASTVAFALVGFSLLVAVLLLVDSLRSFILREAFIRRLFLPVLGACILALLFIPGQYRAIPCALAFVFSLLPYESAIFATCEHIVRFRLSSIRVFAWARLYAAIGLILGLGVGWLAFSSDTFGAVTLQVWVAVVVMFFILVSTTLSMESFYPGDDTLMRSTRIGSDGALVLEDEQVSEKDIERYFKRKCDIVAHRYSLTNRQTEVLYLLAKGRNAAYVQNELVISHHTAKAHIYSIYKKTETHSQQDLMDLIEKCALDGE